MKWRTISDVAAEVGVSPQTLRVWEKQDLLVPDRTAGGQRRYGPEHVRQAAEIVRLRRELGWNPAAIKTTLDATPRRDSKSPDGARLRRARKARGLSLAALAALTESSVSHLSSIERGLDRPSTQLAARLADALGIPQSGLSPFQESTALVVRKGRGTVAALDGGVTWEELTFPGLDIEPALLTVPPGGSSGGLYARPGDTFVHLLDGQLTFRLVAPQHDQEEADHHVLASGDSISIPSGVLLAWENLADGVARALWIEVLAPQIWSDEATQRIVKAATGLAPTVRSHHL